MTGSGLTSSSCRACIRRSCSLQELKPEEEVVVGDLHITPVPVDHAVPTFGYIVTDGKSTVVFGADSGPTERIWQLAA